MNDNTCHKARLVVLGGPMDGREFLLDKPTVTIGRHYEDRDIRLDWDGWVSRRHARITCRRGLYWLQDDGSRHGTFIIEAEGQERKLGPGEQVLISDGTLLHMGKTLLKVVLPIDDAIRSAYVRLKRSIEALRAAQAYLSSDEQKRLRQHLGDFIRRLQNVASEAEVVRIAQEGIPTLEETPRAKEGKEPPLKVSEEDWELPPLPRLEDPNRLPSIRNIFLEEAGGLYRELGGEPDEENT